MTLVQIIHLSASAIFAITAFFGVMFVRQTRAQLRVAAQNSAEIAQLRTVIEQLCERVVALAANHDQTAEKSSAVLGDIQKDVSWLAGEHMVQQAIDLAREGAKIEELVSIAGISQDEAETLKRFQRH